MFDLSLVDWLALGAGLLLGCVVLVLVWWDRRILLGILAVPVVVVPIILYIHWPGFPSAFILGPVAVGLLIGIVLHAEKPRRLPPASVEQPARPPSE